MTTCKRIITPDKICSESALDSVCKLVAQGWKIQTACKFVAEEYQRDYPEDKAEWKTLRQQYYDSNTIKTTKKCRVSTLSNAKKELVPLDLPMVDSTTIDTTKYITIEEHNKIILEYEKACIEDTARLMKENSELKIKLQFFEKDFIETTTEKSTLLPRQAIYDFIKQRGNTIQCHALKSDDLSNEKLFSIFVKVREQYKTSTPPPAWDMNIINATGIL